MNSSDTPHAPEKRRLWDQEEDETALAFSLFQKFCELGPDTSLKDLADQTSRSPGSIRVMSSRHHWFDRASAWRRHLASMACESTAQAVAQSASLTASRKEIIR